MTTIEPRVLYIDDDDGLRRLASKALSRRGYNVTCAGGGEEGVALAAADVFDVIAVDHYMPGIDGLETLARLRELPQAPPVVYVTGSDEGRVAIAALRAGAADYVVKSVGEDFFDLLIASFEIVRTRDAIARAKADAEEGLRSSNARLQALLGEVNHRVANSLQMVAAMVRLQATALTDTGAREALEDTQRRIGAVAQVHRRLYTDDDVESVDMREYLGSLTEELNDAWMAASGLRPVQLDADRLRLPTDKAVSLGVIVVELATNALKYAYADAQGEVRVRLRLEDDDRYLMSVEDDGCGLQPGTSPRGTGLGTRLIRAMASSLGSSVQHDEDHRGCRMTLSGSVI